MDCYKANEKVLDEMADIAHEKAFDEAYDVGTRRRGSKFDEEKYLKIFFQSMVDQAAARNRKDIKDELLDMKQITDLIAEGKDIPEQTETSNEQSQATGETEGDSSDQSANTESEAQNGDSPVETSDGERKSSEILKLTRGGIGVTSDEDLDTFVFERILNEMPTWKPANVRKLAKPRKVLYCTHVMEEDVRKSGFKRFFESENGELSAEVISSLKAIGSKSHLKLFKQAVAAFLNENPEQKKIKMTKSMKTLKKKYNAEDLDALDIKFKELDENLGGLRTKYIRTHTEELADE